MPTALPLRFGGAEVLFPQRVLLNIVLIHFKRACEMHCTLTNTAVGQLFVQAFRLDHLKCTDRQAQDKA